MEIAVLMPAYNEARRISATVAAAKRIPNVTRLVVVDDGSTDDTVKAARQAGAEVIRLETNSGKGAALNVAYRNTPADIYLLLDADLKDSAIRASDLLEPLRSNQADMAIASFCKTDASAGGIGLTRSWAALGIYWLCGLRCGCPLSGQRAVRRAVLEKTGGFASGFGVEVALTVQAIWHQFRVVEVCLPLTHRATANDVAGFLHRGRQFVHITSTIVELWQNRKG